MAITSPEMTASDSSTPTADSADTSPIAQSAIGRKRSTDSGYETASLRARTRGKITKHSTDRKRRMVALNIPQDVIRFHFGARDKVFQSIVGRVSGHAGPSHQRGCEQQPRFPPRSSPNVSARPPVPSHRSQHSG
ncbi:hypothetical protein M409DRAFT_59704 [Zasmidium cellare ATCC 36951]|uniref:Uncharacterized protein n=1 Tax=Zasmidium cellare ATCC 36951 TaxID=1080233 RepID=A0A6A6C0U5_ZASCE|nr:uncharacterized protein M409DRAFT_59704 [Zasmidium cellare ATCC 36951]KAF2160664.1 hypothetical protein M409DRAFT_59704 [Zasmidium cellare ATCC 36951]